MPYASLAQLTARFGERMLIGLTDRGVVAADRIDTGVVDRALADTDEMINGYVAGSYALPFAATPGLIVDLALTIAIYKLHTSAPDPKIEADYKDALRMLRDIASGTLKLSVAGIETPDTGGSGARMTDRERPLSADQMTGFI